jgi:hypothetical protein
MRGLFLFVSVIAVAILLTVNIAAQSNPEKMTLFWIKQDGKYGYIDKTGTIVIPPAFENTMGFREGLAATKLDGKYGYIDMKGDWVIKPTFEFTYMFSEGLAMVRIGKKYAWVNRSGEVVIEPQDFDAVENGFREGRLAVKKGVKWGFIDSKGKLVIPFQFEKVSAFNGGVAQVVSEGHQHHWIDLDGRVLWSEKKSQATQHKEGH